MSTASAVDRTAAALIDYLAASPSPFHACTAAAALLGDAGFTQVAQTAPLPTAPGRYFLVRGGTLLAWSTEHTGDPTAGFRIIGAHTDSPTLRITPQPDLARAGVQQLGVEVYGGPLLNSWLDRDLGLAGRVTLRADGRGPRSPYDVTPGDTSFLRSGVVPAPDGDTSPVGTTTVLVHLDEPLLRVAQLAIHLDRGVNTDGVRLNPQQHLAPIWGLGDDPGDFAAFLADRIGVDPIDVLAWDLATVDTAAPARIGARREFLASGRLDNLATAYAATRALIDAADSGTTSSIPAVVLFDHEEVGSVTDRGAGSELLPTMLERIVASRGGDRGAYHRAMAATVIASGDMAHATHPNYLDKHEPGHRITIGGGPVLKVNNQLRYATGAPGAAAFALACEQAGVPMQRFVTRADLPCGSTVGPVTAARTGAETVDIGAPMLSMHSARELVGVADQAMYLAALTAFLAPA